MNLVGTWVFVGLFAVVMVTNRDTVVAMFASYLPKQTNTPPGPRTAVDSTTPPRRTAERTVELRANRRGHFESRISVNGRTIDAMVDTGATVVALTYEDARAVGIFVGPSDFKYSVKTANGTARVAHVMLDSVSIDDILIRDVEAVVTEEGKMNITLLGMSFLGRLGKAEMSRGLLVLKE